MIQIVCDVANINDQSNRTISKITHNLEKFNYNVIIANMYETYNFLIKHIELINPKILLLLGSTALNALIGNEIVISKARGKWVNKKIGNCNPEIIASFHPAFLMRQPDQKKYAWEDLKMIRKKMSDLKIKLNAK